MKPDTLLKYTEDGSDIDSLTAKHKHFVVVHYTHDDDGIHVSCSCWYDECLGFSPTPEEVLRRADLHRNQEEEIAHD